jgi:drug/metabolite transporter (DMT)-like permease
MDERPWRRPDRQAEIRRMSMNGRNGLSLLFLGAVFGASFLFMRVAAPVLGPFAVAEGRVLIATIALLAIVGRAGVRAFLRDWPGYAFLGLANVALPFGLISFAEVHLSAGLASLINALTPLATAVVAAFWLRQRLTRRRSAAIAVGFAGVAVLVGWSPFALTQETVVAVLASIGATFGYAVGLTYSRRRFHGQPPMTVAFGQLVAATAILAPGALLTLPASVPPTDALLAVLALGLLCTAVAWPILFQLVAAIGPTASSTVTFLVPAFGIAWGALFLGESIGPGTLIGAALVLVSVGLVLEVRLPRRRPVAVPGTVASTD